MELTPAEDTFAEFLGARGRKRSVLRESLVRLRAEADTGLQRRLLASQDARRRHAHEQRALLAGLRGAGGLIGQANAAELLHDVPLPPCERWGEAVVQGYATLNLPLDVYEALAHRQRKTLPHAALVRSGAERVGPHGTIDAQLRIVRLPVVTFRQVADELLAIERGERAVSYNVAVHANIALEPGEEDMDVSGNVARDEPAAQQDGARVWPPTAFGDVVRAQAVTQAVQRLVAFLEEHAPREEGPSLGTAGVDLYRRGCAVASAPLQGVPAADFRELGLCAFTKEPLLLVDLRRRALLLAMTARAQPDPEGAGLEALASKLVELSDLMKRCA